MEPNNEVGSVGTNQHWQLRWGHILLALFFIVLVVIAYVVVHQIKTADKTTQTSLNTKTSKHASTESKTTKNGSSKKTPVASGSKPSSSPSTSSSSSRPQVSTTTTTTSPSSTSTSAGSTSSGSSSSNTTTLTNTGPGDTVGLFIGAATLGAGVHYLYTKRRLGLTK